MSRAVTTFIDKLRAVVGDKGLVTDDAGKHPYLTDWRDNYLGTALAVLRPAAADGGGGESGGQSGSGAYSGCKTSAGN